jgi:hypothetical protein
MSQANINIGSGPSVGDGDPLRTAFIKINDNFTELYSNVSRLTDSVTTVAGRTGNVLLTTQDIIGIDQYLSQSNVSVANTAMTGYVDYSITSNVDSLIDGATSSLNTLNKLAVAIGNNPNFANTVNANIASLYANAAVQANLISQLSSSPNILANVTALESNVSTLFSNAGTQSGQLSSLTSNAAVQSGLIASLTANASVQSGLIANLFSNASVQAGNIANLFSNASVQSGLIALLNSNVTEISSNVTTLFSNAATQSGLISNMISNAAVQSGLIASLTANAAVQSGDITSLFSNAAIQSGKIASVQSNIAIANLAMKGYVDAVTTAWTANAGYQSGLLSSLISNAAIQSGSIASTASNISIANLAMKGYVDSVNVAITSAWTANAAIQSGLIANTASSVTTANTAMKGYVDGQISPLTSNAAIQSGQISSVQSNIIVANLAMKGYVDAVTTAWTANAAYQSVSIVSVQSNIAIANLAMKGYVDAITTAWTANASIQAGNIATLFSNAAVQSGLIASLTANAAVQSGDIASLLSNSAYQSGQISSVQSNIAIANLAMKGYVDAVTTAWTANASIQAGNIATLFSNAAVQSGNIATLFSNIATLFTNSAVQSGLISSAEANITISNTAMKGYVDAVTTAWTANAAVQAGNIARLTANSSIHTANIATLFSNAAVQSGNIATLFSNIATQSGNIATLFSNAAVQSGLIANLTSIINGGNISTSNLTISGQINGNLVPGLNEVYSLGDDINWWSNLYVKSGGLYLGGVPLGIVDNNLTVGGNILSIGPEGVSISTAEIIAGNLLITLSNSSSFWAGSVSNYGDPNVATYLANLTVSGTITSGNAISVLGGIPSTSTSTGAVVVTGGIGVSGNIYATTFTGNYVTVNVISSNVINAYNIFATISTVNQPNIISLGNLTALRANGTIRTTGIVYGNSGLGGTLLTPSQPNVTNLGNLENLNVDGTITTANVISGNIIYSGVLSGFSGIPSTSTSTGAVVVTGGIGVSGNIYATTFTGNYVNSDVIQVSNLTVTDNLVVSGIQKNIGNPAFRVVGNINSNISANTTLTSATGSSVNFNNGSYYNNSTGEFTAPVSGLYQIFFNCGSISSSTSIVYIRRNGSNIGGNVISHWQSNSSGNHFGISTITSLTAGDTLDVTVDSGFVSFGRTDNWGVVFLG